MAASDDVKKLKELIDNPSVKAGGKARYKNKSYSLAELNGLLNTAELEAKAEADARMVQSGRAFEAQGNLEIKTASEKSALKEKVIRARDNLSVELADLSLALENDGDIAAAQQTVREAYIKLREINPTDKMLEGVTLPSISRAGLQREGGTEAATSGAGISPSTADVAERAAIEAEQKRLASDQSLVVKGTPVEIVKNGVTFIRTTYTNGTVTDVQKVVPSGGGGVAPVTTTPTQDARKAFVDAELLKRKLEDTPANRALLRKEYKPAVVAPSTEWESTFRATFPAKAWLLDQDRTKYPQLFALLQKAHDEKYYLSTEGQARFAAELQGVDFYTQLASSGKVREIKSIVGELGFDSTDFSKFVTDSINFGWTGETLKAETYKEVFRKNPDGTYANPTSIKRATVGNDYLNVQLIAKNFFNSAPQSSIESVLTGGITTGDFQRQQREIAKKRYGHLADLIDQGVTLEDLAGNYKQTAAKLLEVDVNSIDMSAADYEVALAFGEEGKKRAMTTGEWEKLLRTDSRYGWEKTENAKTEARSLANNLAQAFGRII
jgi:hypothetical protein